MTAEKREAIVKLYQEKERKILSSPFHNRFEVRDKAEIIQQIRRERDERIRTG